MTYDTVFQISGLPVETLQPLTQFPPYTAIVNCFGEYYRTFGYVTADATQMILAALATIILLFTGGFVIALLFHILKKGHPLRYVGLAVYIATMAGAALYTPIVLAPLTIAFAAVIPIAAAKVIKRYEDKSAKKMLNEERIRNFNDHIEKYNHARQTGKTHQEALQESGMTHEAWDYVKEKGYHEKTMEDKSD